MALGEDPGSEVAQNGGEQAPNYNCDPVWTFQPPGQSQRNV